MLTNMTRALLALRTINGYGTTPDVLHLDKVAVLPNLTIEECELVEQWAGDLIGDLMHLADAMATGEGSIDSWIDRARMHYNEERQEEEDAARIPTTQQIHNALTRAPALDVETWNTGGGTMVTYVIVERKGSPVTVNGIETGVLSATRYIGITHEDEWVICYTDDLWDEGAEYEVRHNLPAYDVEAMCDFVGAMTLACKVFDVSRLLEPLLRNQLVSR
jgi:hypothetical protein